MFLSLTLIIFHTLNKSFKQADETTAWWLSNEFTEGMYLFLSEIILPLLNTRFI